MNKIGWIGIIVWGIIVTGFGLSAIGPIGADQSGSTVQAQDVIFLLAGGTVTCLVGLVGLLGSMGWLPGCAAWNTSKADDEGLSQTHANGHDKPLSAY